MGPPQVPKMIVSRGEPDIQLRIRIDVSTTQTHNGRLIVVTLQNPFQHCAELQRYDLHPDSQFLQILLDYGCHLCALVAGGARNDREFDLRAVAVDEGSVASPGKPSRLQQCARPVEGMGRVRYLLVSPKPITGRDMGPDG